jgi:hypothetical protein
MMTDRLGNRKTGAGRWGTRDAAWFGLAITACAAALLLVACDGAVVPGNGNGGGGSPTPNPSGTPAPTASPTPQPTASPDPSPTPTPNPSLPCAVDADCDDGMFCNGTETCLVNIQQCAPGTSPCDAETEECDEALDECVKLADPGCLSDLDCAAGEFCNLNSGQCLPDFTASCVPGAGVCNIANFSPGCENPDCCTVVCALDPSCCLVQWTQTCAELAFSFSTCLAP